MTPRLLYSTLRTFTIPFCCICLFSPIAKASSSARHDLFPPTLERTSPSTLASIQEETIPFTQDRDGHILFKAMINGVEGNFMFDTGAGINVITKRFFDKLRHLTAEDGIYTGFRATGDRQDVKLYHAQELTIGKNHFTAGPLTYVDLDWGSTDGIISLKNFEKDMIITIDYAAKTLTFSPEGRFSALKKEATAVFPIQLEDLRGMELNIFCRVRVNNKLTLQFCMDSGAGTGLLRINQLFLQDLHIDTTDTAHVRKITHESEFQKGYRNTIFITNIDHLAIDEAQAIDEVNPRAQFVEGLIYDGIMAPDWLGKRITISIPDKEILVQR